MEADREPLRQSTRAKQRVIDASRESHGSSRRLQWVITCCLVEQPFPSQRGTILDLRLGIYNTMSTRLAHLPAGPHSALAPRRRVAEQAKHSTTRRLRLVSPTDGSAAPSLALPGPSRNLQFTLALRNRFRACVKVQVACSDCCVVCASCARRFCAPTLPTPMYGAVVCVCMYKYPTCQHSSAGVVR